MSDMTINYEFKDMATIDVAESISESAHVLIEDDGVIKRTAKSEIGGGVSSWNDLQDKPFHEQESNIVVLDSEFGTDEYGFVGTRFVFENPINLENGKTYKTTVSIELNGDVLAENKTINAVCENNSIGVFIPTDYDEEYGNYGYYLHINNEAFDWTQCFESDIENPVSTFGNVMDEMTFTLKIEVNDLSLKMDEELIPNCVPFVKKAEVGQTIVVKEVDENGKPTEWECVDAGGNDTNLPFTVISAETHPEYFYQGICDLRLLPYFNCYLIKSLRLKYGEGANDYLDCGTTRYNSYGVFLVTSLSQTFYFLSTAIHFNSNGDKSIVYRLMLNNNKEYDNLEYASLSTTYGKI